MINFYNDTIVMLVSRIHSKKKCMTHKRWINYAMNIINKYTWIC